MVIKQLAVEQIDWAKDLTTLLVSHMKNSELLKLADQTGSSFNNLSMDFKLEYCFSLQDFGMQTNSVVSYYSNQRNYLVMIGFQAIGKDLFSKAYQRSLIP